MGRREARGFLDEITSKLREYEPTGDGEPGFVPPWDEYFHAVAQAVALRSKDRGRKVGAIIVGKGNVILSTGFNGFPRGIRETEERAADDEKLFWVTHAETNAIFNAARSGVSLEGATLYVTTYPCPGCAQAIVQAGIRRVFTYGAEYWMKPKNATRYEIAPDLFAEAQVSVDAPKLRAEEVPMWLQRYRRKKAKKKAPGTSAAAPSSREEATQRKHAKIIRKVARPARAAAKEARRTSTKQSRSKPR
jgi:dCMP deaminase